MTTADNAATPTISRLTFAAPIKPGPAPSLAAATYTDRLTQLFDALNAGWTGYRGNPWTTAYSTTLASLPGLHSLRLAVLVPPGRVLFDSTFEGDLASYLRSLRTTLGPLLDVVFSNAEGYPGTRDRSDDEFAAWVRSAQPGADTSGTAPACVAELNYLSRAENTYPARAPSPEAFAFALHAAADLHRLSSLYVIEADALSLQRAARSLLGGLQAQLGSKLSAAEQALRDRFAEAASWFSGTSPAAHPLVAPAAVATAAASGKNIEVNGKQLVTQVMLDPDGNNSVCGYAERMKQSFGLIYLGLDKSDPQYALQSSASNRVIGTITEREAFSRALDATRTVLGPLQGAATFDIKDVSDKVLAALCTFWFDIPDGQSVVASGSVFPIPPGRCPGQFAPPSGYIFQPEPAWYMKLLGQQDGRLLKSHVAQFVARQRASGKPPKGALSSALFAAFPKSPEHDDLLASTIIGVMIGFLPTAQGNLVSAVESWKGAALDSMRHDFLAHPELDIYVRADQVIRPPLMAAMQQSPVPPAIWRTAIKDYVLPDNPPVQVKAGDRLFINIDSATREDLGKHIADVYPIFGGDRDEDNHPTHACPGLWMGMGVLLGTIAGVLEAGPTLAPVTASRGSTVF